MLEPQLSATARVHVYTQRHEHCADEEYAGDVEAAVAGGLIGFEERPGALLGQSSTGSGTWVTGRLARLWGSQATEDTATVRRR